MQAPPSHLYYVHWIHRSCSYSETSPIGLQYYHNSGSLDIISCYLWLYGRDLRTGPATVSRDDMMSWCHGVIVMSSDMITSRKLDFSNISYHCHHHCLWWLHVICFCLIISWLPPSHSPQSKVHLSLLWIRCCLLLLATPHSQLIASPVSQWTTPLSAQRLQFLILKNRCCFPRLPSQISNLESGPLSVV